MTTIDAAIWYAHKNFGFKFWGLSPKLFIGLAEKLGFQLRDFVIFIANVFAMQQDSIITNCNVSLTF